MFDLVLNTFLKFFSTKITDEKSIGNLPIFYCGEYIDNIITGVPTFSMSFIKLTK